MLATDLAYANGLQRQLSLLHFTALLAKPKTALHTIPLHVFSLLPPSLSFPFTFQRMLFPVLSLTFFIATGSTESGSRYDSNDRPNLLVAGPAGGTSPHHLHLPWTRLAAPHVTAVCAYADQSSLIPPFCQFRTCHLYGSYNVRVL